MQMKFNPFAMTDSVDRAAVQLHNIPGDRQPQSRTPGSGAA